MRTTMLSFAVTFALLAGVCNPASAAGWQGGDHSILREHFAEGFTLTRLWRRLDNR